MIGRTLRMMLAVLVLGFGLVALPASAKNFCSPLKNKLKGCRNEIKTCVTNECAGLTGHNKRTCAKACKNDTKTDCKADSTVCTGSPSGAFVR